MSASTAIGMVSSSLRNLLVAEMQLNLTVDVTILAPDENGSDRRINLFLYRVEENPFLRNADPRVDPATQRLLPTPVSLGLNYLMTAYAPNDAQTGNSTAHQILGEAMRVLHDHPVLPPEYLENGLHDAREELRIVNEPLDPEELSRIWATFDQPFRLSVLYRVATVQLDAASALQQPIPARVRQVGVPQVRQPWARPVVDTLTPAAGPAGTALTFTGEHLDGWQARVLFGGRPILPGAPVTGDTVGATVPAETNPGFYDVRVDVAGLFRRTFAFEVTP